MCAARQVHVGCARAAYGREHHLNLSLSGGFLSGDIFVSILNVAGRSIASTFHHVIPSICPSAMMLSLGGRGQGLSLNTKRRGAARQCSASGGRRALAVSAKWNMFEGSDFKNPLDVIKEGTIKLGGSFSSSKGSPSPFGKGGAGPAKDTVFVAGSSGRLGLRIVHELAAAGYRVRAGVRSQDKADAFDDALDDLCVSIGEQLDKKARANINLVYCDLQDEESIEPAIGMASRVICAVGAAESEFTNLSAPKLIDFEATKTLIDVAAACNVSQFILVTSLGTGKLGFPAGVLNLFGGILIWKRKAEEALEQSGMRYLIVRPGGMERPTDNHRAMGYNMRLAKRDTLFGGTVSRLQIAELVTAAVTSPEVATNKCVEVVAELGALDVPYESLLNDMPVEVEQTVREAAMGTIAELAAKEAQIQANIEALSSDLDDTREVISELQQAIKQATAEEQEVLKENTEVLRAAQRTETQIESLREVVAEQKLLAEAARAVAAAQQRGVTGGLVLSPKEIASIREAVLYPEEEEEEEEEEAPAAGAASKSGSWFGKFALPTSEPQALDPEEVVEKGTVARSASKDPRSNNLFDTFVSFLEGDARRGVEESSPADRADEAEVIVEPEEPKSEPTPQAPAESTGFMGGFRIRNMFGGGEYVFIDELDEKVEDEVAREAAIEPRVVAQESIGEAIVESNVKEAPAKTSPNMFPNIGDLVKPLSFEMPEMTFGTSGISESSVVEAQKPMELSSSGSDADANIVEVREWIRDWRERTG